MGSSAKEKDRSRDEGPQRDVSVDGLWVMQTEVTQGLSLEGAGRFDVHAELGSAGGFIEGSGLSFEEVPQGEYALVLQGHVEGRCPWRHRQSLRVPPGIDVMKALITPRIPACPTIDHDYFTHLVPSGKYSPGSAEDELYAGNDEVGARVVVSPFHLGATEVTQRLWTEVMGDNPVVSEKVTSTGASCADYHGVSLVGDALPVACVTWCESVRFANRVSAIEGLQPAYHGIEDCETLGAVGWDEEANGWRLPTEIEWEYAASAGGRHPHVSGTLEPDSEGYCARVRAYGNVADPGFIERFPDRVGRSSMAAFYVQWSCRFRDGDPFLDERIGLAPVGSHRPNHWGLRDMTGNVWEWTWGEYHPSGASDAKVLRGGSFSDEPMYLRVANRAGEEPHRRVYSVGLRLARNAARGKR